MTRFSVLGFSESGWIEQGCSSNDEVQYFIGTLDQLKVPYIVLVDRLNNQEFNIKD